MNNTLDPDALDRTFLKARTANQFTPAPITEETLRALYDLCKWGPTALNCQPMRLVFVTSTQAKQRLCQTLMPGNVEKTMAAPVTAIVAMDRRFYEHIPTQFPAMPRAGLMYEANAALAAETAMRNSSLQAGYLILAARMLGLGTGPMSGFDATAVDAVFFPDGRWHANLLVNLGYEDPAGHYPRGPRLPFDEVARIE
jgi:nitroreductase